ncbi:MAG: type II toxin-antitoxin system VapC family toxin [Rhodocyclaceae bacterium]|nr:type II toxin-antitoxin system VapC family toxin [Rhodocyclaceae bacterium]
MKYLLDTNAVIALLNGHANMNAQARRHAPADVGISSIVAHELYYGACKSRRREGNIALVDALPFEVLEFDKEDARLSGEVRAVLAGEGKTIGPYDVLIAGQALARGLTLVTHNIAEFDRVADLAVEDWEA